MENPSGKRNSWATGLSSILDSHIALTFAQMNFRRWLQQLIKSRKAKMEIVPVFITVDPERDTVEQVRDYVNEFHPDLIGLTGTTDEIRKVARAYRVYYMKTEEEGFDYLVDHSIVMYLMNPKMELVKFYGKNYDVDSLADGIIKEIKGHT